MKGALKERCEKFAVSAYSILHTKGESKETAYWLTENAEKLIRGLPSRTLERSAHAAAALELYTLAVVSLTLAYEPGMDAAKAQWPRARLIIAELMGMKPIRTFERRRQNLTRHWRFMYQNGDTRTKIEITYLSRQRYPDFDLSLLDKPLEEDEHDTQAD